MDIKISKQLLKVIEIKSRQPKPIVGIKSRQPKPTVGIKSRQPKPTVGIFIRPGKDYDDVKTKGKPWLAHISKESVSPDIALFEYMKHTYSQYTFVKLNRNTFHKVKKPDVVFMGFEDLTMPYMKYVVLKSEQYKFDRFYKALKKCKTLYPNMNLIEFITNKCAYIDWLHSNKFKVVDTLCYDLKKYKIRNVTEGIKNWNKIFIKPQPSAESKGILATNKKENVLKHMKALKTKKYEKAIVQKFIPNFEKTRELRTYWINKDYIYTIETLSNYEENPKVRETRLPHIVTSESKRLIELLHKKFGNTFLLRIDWIKYENTYAINEIEFSPGTFAELFDANTWHIDKYLGDVYKKMLTM
jgi:glutathione synthase/RimK-type ligase-like ATP-grasp enzyme